LHTATPLLSRGTKLIRLAVVKLPAIPEYAQIR